MKNKILEKALQLTEAKRATYTLSERTSRLPKATGFALAYSYKDKDHKFVTKLTDLGGKVDRKNKEVRFDFKSASERTKFRKKNKEILSKLDESVELDEGKQLELLKKYGTTIMKMWDKEGASSDEIAKKLKLNSKDTKTLKGLMDESVELDEATREEPKVFWDFKSERDAKQFAKDVENSGVGLANSGVERYKGKYRVVITGMTKDMHKKAIGKYAHKNKGKFSHSTSEVTPKGYGPYDESVEYMSEEGNWTLSIDFDRSMTDQEIKALSNKFKKHFIGSGSDRFGGSDMGFEGPKSDLLKIKQYIEKVFKSQINKKNTFFVPE